MDGARVLHEGVGAEVVIVAGAAAAAGWDATGWLA
jgi:hypothetical protein